MGAIVNCPYTYPISFRPVVVSVLYLKWYRLKFNVGNIREFSLSLFCVSSVNPYKSFLFVEKYLTRLKKIFVFVLYSGNLLTGSCPDVNRGSYSSYLYRVTPRESGRPSLDHRGDVQISSVYVKIHVTHIFCRP